MASSESGAVVAFDTTTWRKPPVGGVDSMEFESILVSKGLPLAEFSQKCIIDAHRSIASHNDVRHLTSGAIRSSRAKFGRLCLYTRKGNNILDKSQPVL
jgi:hypothetical protein